MLIFQPSLISLPKEDLPVKGCGLIPGGEIESPRISGGPHPAPSILEKKGVVTSRKLFCGESGTFIVRKKVCGSVWCPSCFKFKGLKKIVKRLGAFSWERTRHITLTLDRNLFASAKEAFEYVADARKISNMVWNLRRIKGIKVWDWLWVLEWHSDGFAHWHLMVEVDQAGKLGMIGGDILRHFWGLGRVHENPIYGENHWNKLTGYFEEHGYFGDEKGHQLRLPDWAAEWGETMKRKIRRWGAMVLPKTADEKGEEDHDRDIKRIRFGKELARSFRGYKLILSECGSQSRVQMYVNRVWVEKTVDVPYKELRAKFEGMGQYVEKVGYEVEVDWADLALLAEMYDGLIPFVQEIVRQLEFWGAFDVNGMECSAL